MTDQEAQALRLTALATPDEMVDHVERIERVLCPQTDHWSMRESVVYQ